MSNELLQNIACFQPKTQGWLYYMGNEEWTSEQNKALQYGLSDASMICDKIRNTSPNPALVVLVLDPSSYHLLTPINKAGLTLKTK